MVWFSTNQWAQLGQCNSTIISKQPTQHYTIILHASSVDPYKDHMLLCPSSLIFANTCMSVHLCSWASSTFFHIKFTCLFCYLAGCPRPCKDNICCHLLLQHEMLQKWMYWLHHHHLIARKLVLSSTWVCTVEGMGEMPEIHQWSENH